MTEYEVSAPEPVRRSARGALLFLLLVMLLAAAGFAGWTAWQLRQETANALAADDTLVKRLGKEVADLRGTVDQLRANESELAGGQRRDSEELAKLAGRSDADQQSLSQLLADFKGGRTRALLIEVEQLLLLANERAQLAHDPRGAGAALALADERLGVLADPRLLDVRKAIADERAALQPVPQADRAGAALELGKLIESAHGLPLRDRPRAAPAAGNAGAAPPATDSGWWSRGMRSLREVLSAVFIVRRTDKPVDRLLPPEQEALVGQLLALKLEAARAALLLGDTQALRGALDAADQWLGDYYRADDPAVEAARGTLATLHRLELDPVLPDVSRSLVLLRAFIDAQPQAVAGP